MIVKLPTEHHLEFLSLKGGCRHSPESTHVIMPHCWKSHALAQFYIFSEAQMETVNSLLVCIVPFRPFAPGKKAVFNVRIMLAELRSKESDRYKKIRGFA